MTTAVLAVAPASARFGNLRHTALSVFWFGSNFLWIPLTTVLIQDQVIRLVPDESKNTAIGVAIGIGGFLAMLVPPLVGAWSDRLQTRFGRRRPIMVAGTLLTFPGLILLMTANSYAQLVDLVRKRGANVRAILLTHTDVDHIAGLPVLLRELGSLPVAVHDSERHVLTEGKPLRRKWPVELPPIATVTSLVESEKFRAGSLEFEVLHTPGHSPGGVSLRIDNHVFTGDALFDAIRSAIESLHELPSLTETGRLLFNRATLKIYDRPTLRAVVQGIHGLDLAAHDGHDFKGDMYEYLLSKLSASGVAYSSRTLERNRSGSMS